MSELKNHPLDQFDNEIYEDLVACIALLGPACDALSRIVIELSDEDDNRVHHKFIRHCHYEISGCYGMLIDAREAVLSDASGTFADDGPNTALDAIKFHRGRVGDQ